MDDAEFCSKCGSKLTTCERETVAQSISTAEIKEYLGHAKRLEVHRYNLNVAKDRLQEKIDSLGHKNTFFEPVSETSKAFKAFWPAFIIVLVLGLLVSSIVCQDVSDSFFINIVTIVSVVLLFSNEELLLAVGISLGVAAVSGLVFGMYKVSKSKAEHQANLEKHQKDIEEDEKRVELENKQIIALKKQQSDLGCEIAKIDSMLEKLYALDVIKPKYRELVPIVTMHEYFENERCYELTGPTGAYNLYEDELIHQIIIANVKQALSMMERVEASQRALYDALNDSVRFGEEIYSEAINMLESNRAAENNMAIVGYQTKIDAEKSTISAYIGSKA